MTMLQIQAGEVVDVRPLGDAIPNSKTKTLIKTDRLTVIRVVLSNGKSLAEHQAPGEIIIQCLEGRIDVNTMGKTIQLETGQLLYLSAGEPHSVHAIVDSSFLLSVLMTSKPSLVSK